MVSENQINDELTKIMQGILSTQPIKETNVEVKKIKPKLDKKVEAAKLEPVVQIQKPKTPELYSYFTENSLKSVILQEIRDFSPYCENLTLTTLFCLSHWKNCINISPKGQGKSRSTKEVLDLLKINYKELNGRITAKALFEELKNDSIIIIDEAAQILSDKEVQSILLSALNGQEVRWQTTRTSMRHQFKGIIICNANSFSDSNEVRSAVLDRCIVNRFVLNSNQIMEKIKSEKTYTPNLEIWKIIVEKLNLLDICKNFPGIYALDNIGQPVRYNGQPKISKNELFKSLLDKYPEKRTDLQNNIDNYLLNKIEGVVSMRPWDRIQYVADFSYNLIGDFDIVDVLLDALKNTDKVKEISKMNIPRVDKIKMIAELKGYSDVRSARRLLKKIEGGFQ